MLVAMLSPTRSRHARATSVPRPQEHPAHRALHRIVPCPLQGFLAAV